jgi:hypothetical protein
MEYFFTINLPFYIGRSARSLRDPCIGLAAEFLSNKSFSSSV